MADIDAHFAAMEDLLSLPLSPDVRAWLEDGKPIVAFGLPLLGFPPAPSDDNCWGATLLLQQLRPDLARNLVAIRLLGEYALCVQMSRRGEGSQLIEVRLTAPEPPNYLQKTLDEYLDEVKNDRRLAHVVLDRVDDLLVRGSQTYDHVDGGKLPRAHEWRVVRSCVHDRVVGIAGLRQDDQFDGTVVDVFAVSNHPFYVPGHGVRSLMALVLADAYKTGAAMRVRFRAVKDHRKQRVPRSVLTMADELGVQLSSPATGLITHNEGSALFSALAGLSKEARTAIERTSGSQKMNVDAVSYLAISRIWSIEEIEWILSVARRPRAVLFGDAFPENWLDYMEACSIGRAAILATMFRASLNENGEEGIEATDVSVLNGRFQYRVRRATVLPWKEDFALKPGDVIELLPRPRTAIAFEKTLITSDIMHFGELSPPITRRFVVYSHEMTADNLAHAAEVAGTRNVEVIAAPYRLVDLDHIVEERFKRARRVRR